jgi:hypothetical protein
MVVGGGAESRGLTDDAAALLLAMPFCGVGGVCAAKLVFARSVSVLGMG